jgi:hypothetical protein
VTAAAVSRVLRAGGLRPLGSGTPAHREGVRVSGQFVRISVDSPSRERALGDDVVAILVAAGYDVERVSDRIIRWAGQ